MDAAPNLPLAPELVAFLLSGISMQLASADANGLATLVRPLGCRVDPTRTRVTVLVPRSQAEPVLRNVLANGRVAVAFNEPESHRTVQLKGRDAVVEEARPEDAAALPAYVAAMARRLACFEVPEPYVRTLLSVAPGDLIGISFTPSEAYGQTPGPNAGAPLRGAQP